MNLLRHKREYDALIPQEKVFVNADENQVFHTSVLAYINSKNDFDNRIDSGEWVNFVDYLMHYNNRDVDLLTEGVNSYCAMFSGEFHTSPLQSMSMPSFASKLSFQLYDKSLTSIFTFGQKYGYLNEEIRASGLNGGLTGILKLH